jgi:NADPH:quinone reductase-like Zn-dependent oxidoreductase
MTSRWSIQGAFGPDSLKPDSSEVSEPGHGEVLIDVKAVSLNYRDWLTLIGQYNPRQPLPLVPCSDGAGQIAAVGSGVTQWKVGDRVCSTFFQGWQSGQPDHTQLRSTLGGPLPGMLRRQAVLCAEGIVRAPAHLNWEEAACLPCAALTAWNALFGQANLRPGQRVLLIGTGGVSIFALQFAKLAGAQVAILSSSDEKLKRARKLGADFTLNYKTTPSWSKAVVGWSDNHGVDLVVEVGGAGTLAQSLRSLRPLGQVSLIGMLAGAEQPINVLPILMTNLRVQGILVGDRSTFEAMNAAVAASTMRPIVDKVFSFEEAPEAFHAMSTGQHFGKLVISI